MPDPEPFALPVAVRVYPQPQNTKSEHHHARKPWRHPDAMLVFDTESRTDPTQRLTFGSYRFIVSGQCSEEGLIYADDLPSEDVAVLQKYVETHEAAIPEGRQHLRTGQQRRKGYL
ncbi:MAG: hypothetical protein WBE21_03760 [Candidatus Acidiferrales bacterium]